MPMTTELMEKKVTQIIDLFEHKTISDVMNTMVGTIVTLYADAHELTEHEAEAFVDDVTCSLKRVIKRHIGPFEEEGGEA